jgi:hypothetical protein
MTNQFMVENYCSVPPFYTHVQKACLNGPASGLKNRKKSRTVATEVTMVILAQLRGLVQLSARMGKAFREGVFAPAASLVLETFWQHKKTK